MQAKEIGKRFRLYYVLRPQLVKSLVIVIYFFKFKMRNAIIVNYKILFLYNYSTEKSGSQIIELTLMS